MLDHLSHAFHSFPLFALVGLSEKPVRPIAINDMIKVLMAGLFDQRLANQTVAVLGPEELSLEKAVKRVAAVVGKKPLFFRLPIFAHQILAWFCARFMKIPLIAQAQVRILSEGVVEPGPMAEPLPEDLLPKIPFSEEQIKLGLPEAKSFKLADLRCPVCTLCKA